MNIHENSAANSIILLCTYSIEAELGLQVQATN
jgi:hypothetical protein